MIYKYILLFILGLVVIYYSADFLINSSSALASKLNVSKVLIGVSVVAVGTSLPEFVVSIIAILKEEKGLLIGNVLGSNIANIGLVFGLSLIISSVNVNFKIIRYETVILFFVSLFFFSSIFFNSLNFESAIGFILIFIFFIYGLIKKNSLEGEIDQIDQSISSSKIILLLLIGLIGLPIGSEVFIRGAIGIADFFEVPNHIIGMTSVAIGTSIPELAAGIIAARKKEFQIIIGNVLGSNIFNIIFVIGFSLLFTDIEISSFEGIVENAVIFLLFSISFCLLLMLKKIPRYFGFFLMVSYGLFIFYNF